MKLDIAIAELESILRNRLTESAFAELNAVCKDILPGIVYTSFDGDMWSHSELMKQYALKKGLVPLHPESALGTYLVTNHYKGDKRPIIQDCLSLIEVVDHFYTMTTFMPTKEDDLEKQPEGVIAEILYWVARRGEIVTYVDTSDYTSEQEVKYPQDLLRKLNAKQKAGIKEALESSKTMRPVAYLLSGEVHAKHSDWMRKDAYNNSRVPLCPYTLISYGTLQFAFADDFVRRLCCRVALGTRAEELYLYGVDSGEAFDLSRLPDDALVELYAILKIAPQKDVYYKFFGNIGVPKYSDRKRWAITDYEREEVR